jgi:uncharacterized protein (DUF1499 family)
LKYHAGRSFKGTPIFFIFGDQVSARILLQIPAILIMVDFCDKSSGSSYSKICLELRVLRNIQGMEFVIDKAYPVMAIRAYQRAGKR